MIRFYRTPEVARRGCVSLCEPTTGRGTPSGHLNGTDAKQAHHNPRQPNTVYRSTEQRRTNRRYVSGV